MIFRTAATLAGLSLVFASPAQADEPTIQQLLATPSPTEIFDKWAAVCLANAGNQKEQTKAAKDLKIDWPYQTFFDKTEALDSCLVISATETDADVSTLTESISKSFSGDDYKILVSNKDEVSSFGSIGGYAFGIEASAKNQPGSRILSIALIQLKKAPVVD